MDKNNKTPSLTQPAAKTREEWFEILEAYNNNGCEAIARELDRVHNLGFFSNKEKELVAPYEIWLDRFITQDAAMLALKSKIRKLISVSDSVLIVGESGTGKELLAHALHGLKVPESFISINCAGLPEHLIESELFGHVKGSFTGATTDKQGLFQAADKGTLFLDEIGELPISLQAKLLRALQEKKIRKVGSNKEESITCRFVAATHCDLASLVKEKKFRLDLYHRLNTFELHTTPLRLRVGDIPLIVESIDPDKIFPRDFDWQNEIANNGLQGNVRTVQSLVRRMQVFES